MVSVFLIISIILTVVAIAFGGIYMAGMLDTVIEKIGIYVLRTKAKAEEKTLEAQGLKEGQDFFKEELKGNKQAQNVIDEGVADTLKKMTR